MAIVQGWETLPGEFPWPPQNGQVVSPMFVGAYDLRWDDPALLSTGSSQLLAQATGDITVYSTPATLIDATGTLTISSLISAGETVTIGTVSLTAVAGPRTTGSNNFNCSLLTTGLIAQDLANAINDAGNSLTGIILASVSGSVVTLTPLVSEGASGNDIQLVTTSDGVTLSGNTLEGGTDADTITLGGVVSLTAVIGPRTVGGNDFSVDGNTFDIADSIAACISDTTNKFRSIATAVSEFGKVSLTAVPIGSRGNSVYMETSNPVALVLSDNTMSGGSGDTACTGKDNARWTIVGVNVYRSDNGERGPYVRVNKFPVGSQFYRDQTNNTRIDKETVAWSGAWVSKGDQADNRRWAFRTVFYPVVKQSDAGVVGATNQYLKAIPANLPGDVTVQIDGVTVPVDNVFGPNGEITLINDATFDPITEQWVQPVIPTEQSVVTVSYYYSQNKIDTTLDRGTQIFYRLTTVALDPSSPTGYNETPLGYSPPLSVTAVETMDYIWKEAIRRNLWILQQGGERVKLFKRKVSGIPCPCRVDERSLEWNKQPSARCTTCLGSGYVSGYDGPIDCILAPDDAERTVRQTPQGRKLEHTYEVWTGPSPSITQRDFIVKQTGERYSIGPVRRPASRGLSLQQHFNIGYLDEQDIRYRMPITGVTELPWPETRPTDKNTPCGTDPSGPFPVGYGPEEQSSPMETDVGKKVPVGRQSRGRTPIWSNVNTRNSIV